MNSWKIVPINTPAILKHCKKCGALTKFYSSDKFRVNANGKNIDVWLIYNCEHCDTSFNLAVLSRTKPNNVCNMFLENDKDTAFKTAFDIQILNKNQVKPIYENVEYRTEKSGEGEEITIFSEYYFGLRLDKLLADELDISREKSKNILEKNNINVKTKIKAHQKYILKF